MVRPDLPFVAILDSDNASARWLCRRAVLFGGGADSGRYVRLTSVRRARLPIVLTRRLRYRAGRCIKDTTAP
jgi:hypothetical protein